jgi:hypothetical protein
MMVTCKFTSGLIKYLLQIIFINVIPLYPACGQILKGKITNQSGEPIPYGTVYVEDLRLGTTANSAGIYEIRIPAGKNRVVYQSLGYAPYYADISAYDKTITKDVVLHRQYYEIPEVRITATGEDPAYIIMRKVIGLAPYYLNQVNYYKADVYLKGNLVINKIPKLLKRSFRIEGGNESVSASSGKSVKGNIKEGDSFLMESFNEIEFTAPDRYLQKVISFNSTFPEQGDEISPMGFIKASFYQPVLAEIAISPLSPDAFSHYRFRYLGTSMQGSYPVNKIEVIPKRKSQQLFSGTIYIIEDLWCLHSLDLTNENMAGKIRIQQLYIPVNENIWMPVSHKFDVNISILGFRADAGYGSSVKYIDIKPNLALEKPETAPTNYPGKQAIAAASRDTARSKARRQMEKIFSKDELSNRDMFRLSRFMKEESEKSLKDSSAGNLEITDKTKYIIEKDAAKKDSSYWADIRPIPLSEADIRSLHVSDSMKNMINRRNIASDTVSTVTGKQKRTGRVINRIVSGHTWADTSGLRFAYDGLLDLKKLSFNTVDGLVYGQGFRLSKTWENNRRITISPDISRAFSRERFLWNISSAFNYNMMKQSLVYLRAGSTDMDISTAGGINTFINTAATLLLKKNYMKLYESRYLTAGWRSEIVNGLYIDLSWKTEKRRTPENNTDFSFSSSDRPYTDNIPVNRYIDPAREPFVMLPDQNHCEIVTEIEFTPAQRYRINGNTKIPAGSDYPTFSLMWKHFINKPDGMTGKSTRHNFAVIEASDRKETGAYQVFRWRIRTGGFLDNDSLPFYDFTHFNAQPFPFMTHNFEDAFMIPSFYSLSTPEFFTEAHIKYTTPYLFLKLLPGLSNTLIRENISASLLTQGNSPCYTEFGYSLSEIFFLGEIGVYAGFDDIRFRSLGVRFILSID